MFSVLQLHALLCPSDAEKSPGQHAGGGGTRGVRDERAPDTTLCSLLLKRFEPSSPVMSVSSTWAGAASTCMAPSSAEHSPTARSTRAGVGASRSLVSRTRPVLGRHALALSEPIEAVVQSVFGADFVPVRAREKTPAALPNPCCRLALALNLADLILQ